METEEERPNGLIDADTVLAGAPDVKMGSGVGSGVVARRLHRPDLVRGQEAVLLPGEDVQACDVPIGGPRI